MSGNPIKAVHGENVNQTENKSLIYDVGHLKVAYNVCLVEWFQAWGAKIS